MTKSPDHKHDAHFIYEGDIRFGPSYFKLEIDGKEIKGRIFGNVFCWSEDSRYLAVQEWLTLDYQHGPITRVVLIDIEAGKLSAKAKGSGLHI
jgi:hypothetical protein